MKQATQASLFTFLDDATPEHVLQAVSSNHRRWFAGNARGHDSETRHGHGLVVIHTPGPDREISRFPILALGWARHLGRDEITP